MIAEDYDIKIVEQAGLKPKANIDRVAHEITCEYGGSAADLIRLGIEIGQRLARPIRMVPILPDGPCD